MFRRPGSSRVFGSPLVLVVALVLVWVSLGAEGASAARPAKNGHFFGTEDDDDTTADLRVSRSGRAISRGYVRVSMSTRRGCNFKVRLGRRVRIARDGSFSLQTGRVRLRGRFRSRGFGRIIYRPQTRACKGGGTVRVYKDGLRPFKSCRRQRGQTIARTGRGRVFREFRGFDVGFILHVFGCLFDTNRRFDLGESSVSTDEDGEDERDDVRLAGPFVAFTLVDLPSPLRVVDLRNGRHRDPQPIAPTRQGGFKLSTPVLDFELKDNASIGWIAYPLRPAAMPGTSQRIYEVWVRDSQGQRMLDSGTAIGGESLNLSGSTLTWVNGGQQRSATID